MSRFLIFIYFVIFQVGVLAQTNIQATLYNNSKEKLEFGGTYEFGITIYPYELDKLKDEIAVNKELVPFLHIAEVEKVERSENNYDAIVIKFKGILISKYSKEKSYVASLGGNILPLKLEIPEHGKEVTDVNEFVIMAHAKPEKDSNLWVILVFATVCILLGYKFLRKRKKETLYESLSQELSKYTINKQLEYLYGRRKEVISENSDSIHFFEKVGELQYRKDWAKLDKTELIKEKDKVLKGLHGAG